MSGSTQPPAGLASCYPRPPQPPRTRVAPGETVTRTWRKRKRLLIPMGLAMAVVAGTVGCSPAATNDSAAGGSPSAGASSSQAAPAEPANEYAGDYNATYGTFPVLKKSGRGSSVVKLPAGLTAGTLTATHKGSSNFAISAIDSSNQDVDLLVNDIGNYSGTTFVGENFIGTPTKLKITADGSWTIQVKPVAQAPKMKDSTSGKGDYVLLYEMPAKDWRFTHSGSGNFAVNVKGDVDDLLINEIGKYQGVVPMNDGPGVIVITANGSWTAKSQ